MKPRYSILTLLGITAYTAVAVAALAQPATIWTMIHYYSWVALALWLGIEAASLRTPRAVFAAATLFGCLAYVAAISFQPHAGTRHGWYWPLYLRLPHQYLADFVLMDGTLNYSEVEAIDRWAVGNVSLVVGILCGCVALWRYRRLERR